MDGVTFFEYVLDDGPELNFPHGGGRGGGGGFGDFLGALLGGGLFGGGSISGNCFLPGACPSLNVPGIAGLLPHLPAPGCDFGPCSGPSGISNGFLGPGIGNMGLDPIAMLNPWFGTRTKDRECFGMGNPSFGVCQMPCKSTLDDSIGGTAIKFTELQKACGPIFTYPNIIVEEVRFIYVLGVGFQVGQSKVTSCSPNGSVPGGIFPENH